ncbi:MAG TPA: transketolase [Candidatus Lachnoclostridium stercoravium]|uniref:Transketolase n=1 Tax=Candidatus Lachnoclostridium stercoravium TaxID=2838633 RepID=A0A9D2HH56_9FIRM|nr:transketolase [Candidatus Lachnoclostridium stercoravium]
MLSEEKVKELKRFSKKIQMETMKTICEIGMGHVGGSLSISDLLALLYDQEMKIDPKNPKWEERDWLVLSKGHCAPALYSTLALKGYFPMEWLMTVNKNNTNLPSHADRLKVPGVDMTTGSLGQGSSAAAGIALGLKMEDKPNYVYLILGDGECQEGQVWEAALFAPQHKLNHLIAFVDLNRLQLDGFTDDICAMGDMEAKFTDFGWYTQGVNGHDIQAIHMAIENAKRQPEKPSMIILHTIKGNGWSEIAGKTNSHAPTVSKEQLAQALAEMEEAYAQI